MTERLSSIDRILSSEPPVEPSAHFTESVMAAVKIQSSDSAFAFPWRWFLLGCAGAALVGVFAWLAVTLKLFGGGPGVPLALFAIATASLVSFASFRLSEVLVT